MQEEESTDKALSNLLKQIKITFRQYTKEDQPPPSRLKARIQRLVTALNKQPVSSTQIVGQMIAPALHQPVKQHLYCTLVQMNAPHQLDEKYKEVRDRQQEAYCLQSMNIKQLLKEVIDHSIRTEHQLLVLKQSLGKVQWNQETGVPPCPSSIKLAHLLKIYIQDSRVEFDSGLNQIFFRTVILEESVRLILQKAYKAVEEIGQNWLKDFTLCPPSRFNSALSSQLRHTNFFRDEEQGTQHNLRALLKPHRNSRPIGRIDPDYRIQPKKEKRVRRVERLFGCCF